jgi:hypothetical protein
VVFTVVASASATCRYAIIAYTILAKVELAVMTVTSTIGKASSSEGVIATAAIVVIL